MQAHLKAQKYYSVVANMRGRTAHDVARPLLDSQELHGLEVRLSWGQALYLACVQVLGGEMYVLQSYVVYCSTLEGLCGTRGATARLRGVLRGTSEHLPL